jgi:DNA-binding XRE family transcriptional regulator
VEVSGHLPEFATVCRLLRVVLGFAQEDLAAHLYVSRKSVQRWERALAVPDDRAEEMLAELCRQRRVFEHASAELEAAGVVDGVPSRRRWCGPGARDRCCLRDARSRWRAQHWWAAMTTCGH